MRVAIVGDALLDVDLSGRADRLSPDGPVPVVALTDTQRRPGGAGLVATLLARDGVDVLLATALSDDARGHELRELLTEVGRRGPSWGTIEVRSTVRHGSTPVKTRVRAGGQSIVRIDEGGAACDTDAFDAETLKAIVACDAIAVADYGNGVSADEGLRGMLEQRPPSCPLVWDPHPRGSRPPHTATVVTPNQDEATACGVPVGVTTADALHAGEALVRRWRVPAVALTLGERGAVLTHVGGTRRHVVASALLPAVDTCGAGDRLTASVVLALASGATLPDAVEQGVSSAHAFLAAGGVAALVGASSPADLLPRPMRDAVAFAAAVHAGGGTVVALGGRLDPGRADVARSLAAARALGDCLIVCVEADRSGLALAGITRPTPTVQDHRTPLLALDCVDAVAVFDGHGPRRLLERLRPDIWVTQGIPVDGDTPEAVLVAGWGGQTVTLGSFAPQHDIRRAPMLRRAS